MDHRAISVVRLAATALLVCTAAVGCAGRGAPEPAGRTPAAQWVQTDLPALAPTPDMTDSPASSPTAGPTTDQLPDLSDLDDLLNGINGSLSGANAGPSGGE